MEADERCSPPPIPLAIRLPPHARAHATQQAAVGYAFGSYPRGPGVLGGVLSLSVGDVNPHLHVTHRQKTPFSFLKNQSIVLQCTVI